MKKHSLKILALTGISVLALIFLTGGGAGPPYDKNPRFRLTGLQEARLPAGMPVPSGKVFNPKNSYGIFINYELGMHCAGFDISYCCIIPPYNSIQAQVVRAGENGELPQLLGPEDKIRLYYRVRDNSYSEGNKMKYWMVGKDANGNGKLGDPNDNIANYVWTHLFIYKDLLGTLPADWAPEKRLRIGRQIPIPIDAGPSGKPLAGGPMDYAGPDGGNIVFTDSLIPEVQNISLKLTASHVWDALGLPLTAFNDSLRHGTIRTITNRDFQPYQYSTVELRDAAGALVQVRGKSVEFFGTNPVSIANCYTCHSGKGVAAERARKEGLKTFDEEYHYWKSNYPDMSEYMARLSSASVCVLELHDQSQGTHFLKDYRSDAPTSRLGEVGVVNCTDCHGDNVSGNLQTPRPTASGYPTLKGQPLSEVVHSVHLEAVSMPDKAGRPQNCQACHPTHWQNPDKNDFTTNPFQIIDEEGRPRFSDADLRISGGGCYLRRDAMTNPHVMPPFFLNEIGRWYLTNVSAKDENGNQVSELRGLYCTDCHNALSQALYQYDDLADADRQVGKTLRDRSVRDIVKTLAAGDAKKFADSLADPKVSAPETPLVSYYKDHKGATLVRAGKDPAGRLKLLPWNEKAGDPVPYQAASGGSDWWLAAAEPHCANCHLAPFVESEGGSYFPIDQPNKYALFRYSKAHANLACQSCHESIHGLYPVRYEGDKDTVDLTTHQQALQFSPDGTYAGPITCAACHTINEMGVPVQLRGTDYFSDYWASVVLVHSMRGEDFELPVAGLLKKFPYQRSQEIVRKGWK